MCRVAFLRYFTWKGGMRWSWWLSETTSWSPYDHQIMTPRQLFEWAVDNIPAISFQYLTTDDYKREEALLEHRFEQSRTIPGTRKLHCFIPLSRKHVCTKVYSSSSTSKRERVTLVENELLPEKINFKDLLHVPMMRSGGLHVFFKCPMTMNKYVLASSILMDHHDHSNIQPDQTFWLFQSRMF